MNESTVREAVRSRVTFEDLDMWVRQKVQSLIQAILEEEVTEFLGRMHYQRRDTLDGPAGYRNGYGRPRKLTLSCVQSLAHSLGQSLGHWCAVVRPHRHSAILVRMAWHDALVRVDAFNGISFGLRSVDGPIGRSMSQEALREMGPDYSARYLRRCWRSMQ